MENKKKHYSRLSLKLNILIIVIILSVSTGLVLITYRTYCRKINEVYFEKVEKLADILEDSIYGEDIQWLRDMIGTEEFKKIRAEAQEKNDPSLIREWMEDQVVGSYVQMVVDEELAQEEEEQEQSVLTLADFYDGIYTTLASTKKSFQVLSTYVQYDEDNVTYDLIDSSGDLLRLGMPEEYHEEFSAYKDNAEVPATIAFMDGHVICTAAVPVIYWETEEPAGFVGVDISMDEVIQEQRWFLWNCIAFVVILTVVAILTAMFIIRRMLVRPLTNLAAETTKFGRGGRDYQEGDIISLDIHSKDEIEDLYTEIRSMQGRIVDYADNLAQITSEKERTLTELRTAARIQEAMIPDNFPEREEFDLRGIMTPAREVGGDFYDFFFRDEDHLVLVIADVSGKGIPAALFMMAARILINDRAMMGGTPAEILTAVNDRMSPSNTYDMFVTVWLGILEISTGKMVCANAGHEYPVLRERDGRFALLKDRHGFVLGAMEDRSYTDYEIELQEGSCLFVYTDGVAEACSASLEQYGTDRIIEALNDDPERSPGELLAHVRDSVSVFVEEAPQFDDMTMLCLKYKNR